jgi:hypothetical protein
VSVAGTQGSPEGLFVVTVIVTMLPASPGAGVYVNENGDVPVDEGLTLPKPFPVIFTAVALPPKMLPLTVIGLSTHVDPDELPSVSVGGSLHPVVAERSAIAVPSGS